MSVVIQVMPNSESASCGKHVQNEFSYKVWFLFVGMDPNKLRICLTISSRFGQARPK